MTPRLSLGNFTGFFAQLYGEAPFPWQTALAARVMQDGQWPDIIDVPTGLGKTAVLDVAVFMAAARPDLGRRRIYLVVDRRLIVDQAHTHALRLQAALQSGQGICGEIGGLLRADGDQLALDVTRMRGGTTWSWRWLERPDRHAIITGTVDQIGSRLLFRGYGVGEYLRPIDAALTGTDSLIVVDEAHLAEPFVRTVTDAAALELRRGWREPVIVTMSATTARQPSRQRHAITHADEQDDRAGKRLRAAKGMRLVVPPKGGVERCLAGWAAELAGPDESGRIVTVICNTIGCARAVHGLLAAGPAETRLLIGRIRSIDRDYLMRTGWYDKARSGRTRGTGCPLILVSTQTIEVGADIDADALVTESASLAALVQRLGRLNRLGALLDAPALVVHDPAATDKDPVYGPARLATWQWLCTLTDPVTLKPGVQLPEGFDASPLALRRLIGELDPDTLSSMRPPHPYVPVLNAATLDAWTRTSPVPHPDTPVAPFLHGIDNGEPDVSIVWRSRQNGISDRQWRQQTASVPPSTEEAIQVPVHAARRWLAGAPAMAAALGDFDSTASDADIHNDGTDSPTQWQILRYRNPNTIDPVRTDQIVPGDLLIVPAEMGGCDEYGWNPASAARVTDVADFAFRRGRPMLRLTAALPGTAAAHHPGLREDIAELVAHALADLNNEALDTPSYRKILTAISDATPRPDDPHEAEPLLVWNLRILASTGHAYPYPQQGEDITPAGVLLTRRGGGLETDRTALGSSALGYPAGLAEHQQAVRRRASEFARNLELDARTAATIGQAAAFHDEGKRDPRFQAMLHGRPVRWLTPQLRLLAKSGMDPADRAALRRARQVAGYPHGMRHEALSALIAAQVAQTAGDDIDPDLFVHLVAAHHGRSRPLLPPVADPEPQVVQAGPHQVPTGQTVDWEEPARFARLNQRYGRWGLALMETIVRLADIWCSEHDERGSGEEAP